MPETEIYFDTTPFVYLQTREGYVGISDNLPDFFTQLKIAAHAALTAENGVDKKAEGPTRTHPVYIKVPDRDVQSAPELGTRGRYRIGAVSPDNPHYDALAGLLEGHLAFPEKAQPPLTFKLDAKLIPSDVLGHPKGHIAIAMLEKKLLGALEFIDQAKPHEYIDIIREQKFLNEVSSAPAPYLRQNLMQLNKS